MLSTPLVNNRYSKAHVNAKESNLSEIMQYIKYELKNSPMYWSKPKGDSADSDWENYGKQIIQDTMPEIKMIKDSISVSEATKAIKDLYVQMWKARKNEADKKQNAWKTDAELQKMNRHEILELIRSKKVTYADVDNALEKIKAFSTLDWLGDKLAEDDLKGKKQNASMPENVTSAQYDKAKELGEETTMEVGSKKRGGSIYQGYFYYVGSVSDGFKRVKVEGKKQNADDIEVDPKTIKSMKDRLDKPVKVDLSKMAKQIDELKKKIKESQGKVSPSELRKMKDEHDKLLAQYQSSYK